MDKYFSLPIGFRGWHQSYCKLRMQKYQLTEILLNHTKKESEKGKTQSALNKVEDWKLYEEKKKETDRKTSVVFLVITYKEFYKYIWISIKLS